MTADQLDLFDLADGVLDAQDEKAKAREEHNKRRAEETERRRALLTQRWNTDPLHRVRRRDEWVCGRCGELTTFGHGGGYTGCPVGVDPVWKYYPLREGHGNGYRKVRDDFLTDNELCVRWDADQWPWCECGHPFGVHVHQYGMAEPVPTAGLSCTTYCGCPEYSERTS